MSYDTNLYFEWLYVFKLLSTVVKRDNLYVLQYTRIVVVHLNDLFSAEQHT